jgi:mono/diheme cytochrome c family protein
VDFSGRLRGNLFSGTLRNRSLALMVAAAALTAPPSAFGATADPVRGKYVLAAAGCAACHTDKKNKGRPLAGGRALKTPFGVFYSPNITPDPVHGIGRWSDADFVRALRHGRAPDGGHFFPAFPYPSYTAMNERDMLDLKAHLFTLPPVAQPNKPHDLTPPFGWRFLVSFWKLLYFTPGPYRPDPAKGDEWNRGAYLVRALGHCGECHTPRDPLGGKKPGMELAGTESGPEGGIIPNITPDKDTGIGGWRDRQLADFLESGMQPDGDYVGGAMGEVIDENTGRLTDADRRAIIAYLKSLPPVRHKVEKKKKAGG